MEEKLPKRKNNRIKNYDYSSTGAYFITICTKERQNYFWGNQCGFVDSLTNIKLSQYGKVVDTAIKKIPIIYPAASVEHYVIMPDHVHLLLLIQGDESGRPMVAPTIDRIIKQMKGYITKKIGFSVWQKLFFDHVIRNSKDYEEHVKYIYENPIRWLSKKEIQKEETR